MITPEVRLERALTVAARYRIHPCKRDKTPLVKDWPHEATTDPSKIREWWTKYPHALIGQVTGQAGTVVLDIDTTDGAPLTTRTADFCGDHQLPTTLTYPTLKGGAHYHFRVSREIRNSAGKLAKCVDIRGAGGYVIRWDAESETGLCAVEPVPMPDWLEERIEADGTHRTSGPTDGAPIVEGARNDTLASLAGTMRRRGMSPAAIEAALIAENAARCRPPLSDREVRGIAASVGRYAPGDDYGASRAEDSDDGNPHDLGDGYFDSMGAPECATECPRVEASEADDPEPGRNARDFDDVKVDDLIEKAPSRIQKWVKWVLSNSERPVPQFALASGLAFVGHVTGRGFCGPTGLGPNLYQVLLGRTESGKDNNAMRPLSQACSEADDWISGRLEDERGMSYRVDMDHYPGARLLEKFASGQSIHAAMEDSPCITLSVSELGYLLARASGNGAPDYMSAIREELLDMFGKDATTVPRKRYAERRRPTLPIVHPTLAMLGGMNDAHCRNIDIGTIKDGLLNRCIVITAPRPQWRVVFTKTGVPGDLIEWAINTAAAIYPGPPLADDGDKIQIAQWRMIDYADDKARDAYRDLTATKADGMDDNPLHGRHGIKLIKAALNIALARETSVNTKITAADFEWADTYLTRCNEAAIPGIMRFGGLVSSEHHADLITLCEQINGVEKVYVTRLFRKRKLRDREDILLAAHAIGLISFIDKDGKVVAVNGRGLPRGVSVKPNKNPIDGFMAMRNPDAA